MSAPRLLTLSASCSSPSTATSLIKHSPTIFPLSSSTRNPNSSSSNLIHCCYTKNKPPSRNTNSIKNSSDWDSNAESLRSDRSRYKIDDYSIEDDDDEEDYSTSGSSRFRWRENRERKWWSDGGGDDLDGGGVVEDVIENVWFLKVLRSYGWLLPAIIISMLLASGPKAFLMAIALPLGQSAVSFIIDKVFGRTRDRPRPKPKTKRKPFSGSVEINDEDNGIGEKKQGYQSWVVADNGSVQQKVDQRKPRFGGWDELDKQQSSSDKGTARMQRQTPGKMSRKGRRRDTSLLLRLLVAVFPFLSSWTKLL